MFLSRFRLPSLLYFFVSLLLTSHLVFLSRSSTFSLFVWVRARRLFEASAQPEVDEGGESKGNSSSPPYPLLVLQEWVIISLALQAGVNHLILA